MIAAAFLITALCASVAFLGVWLIAGWRVTPFDRVSLALTVGFNAAMAALYGTQVLTAFIVAHRP